MLKPNTPYEGDVLWLFVSANHYRVGPKISFTEITGGKLNSLDVSYDKYVLIIKNRDLILDCNYSYDSLRDFRGLSVFLFRLYSNLGAAWWVFPAVFYRNTLPGRDRWSASFGGVIWHSFFNVRLDAIESEVGAQCVKISVITSSTVLAIKGVTLSRLPPVCDFCFPSTKWALSMPFLIYGIFLFHILWVAGLTLLCGEVCLSVFKNCLPRCRSPEFLWHSWASLAQASTYCKNDWLQASPQPSRTGRGTPTESFF